MALISSLSETALLNYKRDKIEAQKRPLQDLFELRKSFWVCADRGSGPVYSG